MSTEEYKEKYCTTILNFLQRTINRNVCSTLLKKELQRVQESANYKAPELMVDIWRETSRMLNMYKAHDDINKDWQKICEELTADYRSLQI